MLDDVGSSKPSLWALETVGHVLNTRYNEKRVTLLTTNFLDSEVPAQSDGPRQPPRVAGMRAPTIEDSLTERVGKRIRSRLYEMCRTIEISAPDYRKEIRHTSRFRARLSDSKAVCISRIYFYVDPYIFAISCADLLSSGAKAVDFG